MNTENKWSLWTRNVVDKFKDIPTEKIKEELLRTSFPFAIMMAHIEKDFNFGSVVRSANAFNAREVFYFGSKHWDKRSATGVYNYTSVNFLKSMEDILKLKEEYYFVAMENSEGSIPLNTFDWKVSNKKPLIIIGEENAGIPSEILNLSEVKLEIQQFGSVRSLNAAVAASISMYDFVSKYSANNSI